MKTQITNHNGIVRSFSVEAFKKAKNGSADDDAMEVYDHVLGEKTKYTEIQTALNKLEALITTGKVTQP